MRLNNNSEFTHKNPATLSPTAEAHGCIRMSGCNARAFHDMVILSDPVDAVNCPVRLPGADDVVSDWAVPWDEWRSMSAKV